MTRSPTATAQPVGSWPKTVPTFFSRYHFIRSPEQMPHDAVRIRMSSSLSRRGTGTLTTSGAITQRTVAKGLTASLSLSGALAKNVAKGFAGTLTTAGALVAALLEQATAIRVFVAPAMARFSARAGRSLAAASGLAQFSATVAPNLTASGSPDLEAGEP